MSEERKGLIYFYLGTEAELIKIFTIIRELINKGYQVKVIASGQNKISKSRVLAEANGGIIDITINEADIKQTPASLLFWFLKTYSLSKKILKDEFSKIDKTKSLLIVHGDTISTFMGARIAKRLGMKVAHLEAGLRSHDFFSPFPEEIDRIITSWYTDIHFAPCQEGVDNLQNTKGKKVNTFVNSVYDSYIYSKSVPLANEDLGKIFSTPYFVFVVHRSENLANESYMYKIVERVIAEAKPNMKCLFIMHGPTEFTLNKLGLIEKIKANKNIYLMSRLDYFDFMKVIDSAAYVITDGGSNQQELYFIGAPCILMRKTTEQPEGLGENILLSKNEISALDNFLKNYKSYRRSPFQAKISPTKIIVEAIDDEFK